jgi:EpsI family protein
VAYYGSQSIGETTHSPQICIPGGGWDILSIEPKAVSYSVAGRSTTITANRVVISKGHDRQIVYYWFQGRGRTEINDYFLKLNLMRDAIFRNRTDGSLVRFVTPITNPADEGQADKVALQFIAAAMPRLSSYLPE